MGVARMGVMMCVAGVLAGGAAPVAAPAGAKAGATFPHGVAAKYASEKPSAGRMHTCLDQYKANKAGGGNGGMKWIQKGGGYYSVCLKHLKEK